MNNIHENTNYKPPIALLVCDGTTACKVGIGTRKIEQIYGIVDPAKQLDILAMDASGITTTFPVPMLEESQQHQTLGPNENLSCPLHDSESLHKAEQNGNLWFMPPDWYLKPGVAKDNVGSGGNPRTGNVLGRLNINQLTKKLRNKLRRCQTYCKQREILHSSEDEKITSTPINVLVCASFLGGFGNGNVITILQILRQLERELKIQIRIIFLGIIMGTLEPTDKFTAARNQEMLLRELDSCIIGQFKNIEDRSPTMQILCDSMLLFSNVNNFGEIENIDKVISHVSNYIFTLFHNTLGNQILERCVDIEENWPDDENGGKLWASTAAITKIHLDSPRIIKCVGYKLLELFFERILLDNEIKQAQTEADLICAEQMLEEKDSKNLAFQRLTRTESNGSLHAIDDTIRMFHDRSGSSSGYQKCCDLANASRYILNTYIPRNVEPSIARQSVLIIENVKKALHNFIATVLQRPDGFSFSRQFLSAISANLIRYTGANAKKLNNAQARKKSIDDRLTLGHTLIKKLECRNILFRFLSFGTKRSCRDIFTLQTEQAIRTAIEIKARIEIANEVYPAILEFITEKQKIIQKSIEKALETKNNIKLQSKRLEDFSPILLVPIGLELANSKLINDKYTQTLKAEGDQDKVFSNIFSQFQSNFANLEAFNHHNCDQIKNVLLEYCCDVASSRLAGLNVIDALEEYSSTSMEKNRLIDQAIRESSGSVRTTGEGGCSIPTIKFIGSGDCHRILWLENAANNIDKTDGQWKSFETGDKNTIIFLQQRSRVSISKIIKWTSTMWIKPESFEEFAKLSSSPIMAFAPTSCDSQEQLKSIIAMGLVTERLEHFKPENLSKNMLEMDFDKIITKVQNDLPLRVDIYRDFIIDITVNYKKIIEKLKKTSQYFNDKNLIDKIGIENFDKAASIAKVLYPHLSRLPEETQGWLKIQVLKKCSKIPCIE